VAYFPDPTDGKGIARAIEQWKATLVCGAPSFLKGIFKNYEEHQLDSLHFCVTGAEKAPDELFNLVRNLGHCQLVEGYGITECSPVITINMSGNPNKGVGIPLKGIELLVVSLETHRPLPVGEQGLILVRGPSVFKGYLNKGLSSPFLEVEGKQWYSTGDLGHLESDGSLIISGRLKRFIKIGGEMVSLAAIEDALFKTANRDASVNDGPSLAVCAKEEPGERPKIFVFARFEISLEEVNKALRESGFSNLVKVFMVERVEDIPLMGTGKTNYRYLESLIPSLLERQKSQKLENISQSER
jgi:long-chain-fatty-acid--[acyl-carrier-protein] ligase